MAKTKRRQLAALAALADSNKGVTSHVDRISSCQDSGPSGTFPLTGTPTVEIRTQRVIFKIPALPSPANAPRCLDDTRKPVFGKHRKVKSSRDIDLGSEVPADEAKLSKVILTLGRWKREKRIRDLLPSEADAAASAGQWNEDHVRKALVSERCLDGDAQLAAAPLEQSQAKANLTAGSGKRVKLQDHVDNLQVKSPAEMDIESLGVQCTINKAMTSEKEINRLEMGSRLGEVKGCMQQTAVSPLVPAKDRWRDTLSNATDRSQDLAKTCNGNENNSLAHSQSLRKRKHGETGGVNGQVTVGTKAAVTKHRAGRRRAAMSNTEAVAPGASRKIQHRETIMQRRKNFRTSKQDIMLVSRVANGISSHSTPHKTQEEGQHAPILISPTLRKKEQSTHVRLAVTPSHLEATTRQNHKAQPISRQSNAQDEDEKDVNPQLQTEEITPGDEVQVVGKQYLDIGQSARCSGGKDTVVSGAQLIKQERQLAIVKKRLEAAGGFRKWLLDKGLEQFVPILESRKIDSFSLMQLTMARLKGMGVLPVGPRRKLIHAIHCLTQPSLSRFLRPLR